MKAVVVGFVVAVLSGAGLHGQSAPSIDCHQHLFNPSTAALSPGAAQVSADELVKLLDQAGIRRAVVLSVAYQCGNPNRPAVDDEYAKVRAENDLTSRDVARFPDRLRGFCGVDPLKGYALEELARCAKDPQLHVGLKRHFGNSDVDFENPRHVSQLREVFRAANAHVYFDASGVARLGQWKDRADLIATRTRQLHLAPYMR